MFRSPSPSNASDDAVPQQQSSSSVDADNLSLYQHYKEIIQANCAEYAEEVIGALWVHYVSSTLNYSDLITAGGFDMLMRIYQEATDAKLKSLAQILHANLIIQNKESSTELANVSKYINDLNALTQSDDMMKVAYAYYCLVSLKSYTAFKETIASILEIDQLIADIKNPDKHLSHAHIVSCLTFVIRARIDSQAAADQYIERISGVIKANKNSKGVVQKILLLRHLANITEYQEDVIAMWRYLGIPYLFSLAQDADLDIASSAKQLLRKMGSYVFVDRRGMRIKVSIAWLSSSDQPPSFGNNMRIVDDAFLGKGGFSCVIKCMTADATPIAVKVIKPKQGSSVARLLRSEIRYMQLCAHENVMQLLGVFELFGHVCLALPLMETGSLKGALGKKNSTLQIFKWLAVIAKALAWIHSKRIVHMDLTLGNILIQGEKLVITDFGLSRKLPAEGVLCSSKYLGSAPGKIGYLDPWLLEARVSYGTEVDLFSFGVVVWALLSGEYPWVMLWKAVLKQSPELKESGFKAWVGRQLLRGARLPVKGLPSKGVALIEGCWDKRRQLRFRAGEAEEYCRQQVLDLGQAGAQATC